MINHNLMRTWMSTDKFRPARVLDHLRDRHASPREVAADEGIAAHGRLWILSRALWHRDRPAARRLAIDSAASMSALAGDRDAQAEHVALVASLRSMIDLIDLPSDLIDLPPDAYVTERRAWSVRWNATRKHSAHKWNASRTRVALESMCGGHLPDLEPISAQVAAWDAAWDASGDSYISVWYALLAPYWAAHDSGTKTLALTAAIFTVLAAFGDDADGWIEATEVAA